MPETAAPTDLNDINLTDEAVALDYASKCPLAMRMAFGDNLKAMLLSVISRERARCKRVLAMGARYYEQQVRSIEGMIQSAIMGGSPARAEQLGVKRAETIAMARAVTAAVQVIGREPGGCPKCGGTKMVPSAVAMASGQRALLPCPSCVPPQAGAAADSATDAASSSSSDAAASPG